MEERVLPSLACLEGEEVYFQVHHEGALDQTDQEGKELVMTSHCRRLHHDLREEGVEEALYVSRIDFFPEMAVFHLVGEAGVLLDHEVERQHGY